MQKFSIDEAIQYGWNTMKENIGFFIVILIIVAVVQMVPSFIVESIKTTMPVLTLVISFLSMLVNMVMGIGLIRIVLKLHDTRNADVGDLFACGPSVFFKYLAGSFFYILIIIGVVVMLVVPEFVAIYKGGKEHIVLVGLLAALAVVAGAVILTWLMLMLQFYGYLIVDQNLGPMAALTKSAAITRGAKGQLLLLWLILGLINLAGVLACFVGLFATIPLTTMATVFVYRKLLSGGSL
jgi:uncharacterized membrane protein